MSSQHLPSTDSIFSLDNALFKTYVFWTSALLLKTALMSLLPTLQPLITSKIFRPWPEEYDAMLQNDLKRVRAAHRNDLENNFIICMVAFLYLLTDPPAVLAGTLIRVICAFRAFHSLIYGVYPVRQPARSIGFLVPWFLMAYMCSACLWTFVEWL